MMKNIFIYFIFLVCGSSIAQTVKVLDKETGRGVKNVSIFNEDNTVSLSTDKEGFADLS